MALDSEGALSFGVKIGRRSVEIVLIDFVGRVRRTLRETYRWPMPDAIVTFLKRSLTTLMDELSPDDCRALAAKTGGLLATTLPARGLFHDHPFGLGITGSYFTSLGREMYEAADVVLAVGTSLSYYVGGGHFWSKAYKIQLDDAST